MITLAARAAKVVARKVVARKVVARKVGRPRKTVAPKKRGPGRPRTRTEADKKAYARAYYVKKRAHLLKLAQKWYKAHKAHKKAYVKKWRKKTANGTKPYYMQKKPNGKRPIYDPLPRLNGKGPRRNAATNKAPPKTAAARAKMEKTLRKADEARERAKKGTTGKKRGRPPGKKPVGRPRKVGRPAKK